MDYLRAMQLWALLLPHVRAQRWAPIGWRTMLIGGLAQLVAQRIGVRVPKPAALSPVRAELWARGLGLWAEEFSDLVQRAPAFCGTGAAPLGRAFDALRYISADTVLCVIAAVGQRCRACGQHRCAGLEGCYMAPSTRYTVPQPTVEALHRTLTGLTGGQRFGRVGQIACKPAAGLVGQGCPCGACGGLRAA